MNVNTKNILEKLVSSNPDTTIFRKATIVDTAKSLGYSKADWSPLLQTKAEVRGQYDLSAVILPALINSKFSGIISIIFLKTLIP